MADPGYVICDGCGRAASPEHVARRLQRLEWSTRFRPVHIGTLLLGAIAPANDAEYLYAPTDRPTGEARIFLEAAGVSTDGKPFETVLNEFQRAGLFLAYVMECPIEDAAADRLAALIEARLAPAMTRIRRSLRPKRLAVISRALSRSLKSLQEGNLGCALVLDGGEPFAADQSDAGIARLREALRGQSSMRLTAG